VVTWPKGSSTVLSKGMAIKKRKISPRTSGIHSAYHPTSKTFFRQRVFHKIGQFFGEIFMVGTNDYIS
jgi:hypothetical protein